MGTKKTQPTRGWDVLLFFRSHTHAPRLVRCCSVCSDPAKHATERRPGSTRGISRLARLRLVHTEGPNMPQPACRDWTRTGSCRFGNRCRFSHAGPPGSAGGSGGSGSSNRYAGKQDQPMGYSGGPSKGGSSYGGRQGMSARSVKQVIESDMNEEMPMWPLTCYAHEREGPNIINGDISFEEVRAWQYGVAIQVGQPPCTIPQLIQEFQDSVSKKQSLMHRLKTLPLKVLQNLIDNKSVLDESNIHTQPSTKGGPHKNNSMQFDRHGVGHPVGGSHHGSPFPPNGPSGGMGQDAGFPSGMQAQAIQSPVGTGTMFNQHPQYMGGAVGMQQQNTSSVAGPAIPATQFPSATGGFQQPSQFAHQSANQAGQGPFAAPSAGAFQQASPHVQGFQPQNPMAQGIAPSSIGASMVQGSAMASPGQMSAFQSAPGATGFPSGGTFQSFDHSGGLPSGGTPAPGGPGMNPGMNGQAQGAQNGFGGPTGQPPMDASQVGAGMGFQQQGFSSLAPQGPSQGTHLASGTDSNAQMWQQQGFESGQVPDTPPGELFCK